LIFLGHKKSNRGVSLSDLCETSALSALRLFRFCRLQRRRANEDRLGDFFRDPWCPLWLKAFADGANRYPAD